MLSKPVHGWSSFRLGDFHTEINYLTDIPFSWLESIHQGLTQHLPIILRMDTGDSEAYINLSGDTTHIVVEKEKQLYVRPCDIDCHSFARELIHDLKRNFDDWVRWLDQDAASDKLDGRRHALYKLIAGVEALL